MLDRATRKLLDSLGRLSRLNAAVTERGIRLYSDGLAHGSKMIDLNSYLMQHWVSGGVAPLMKSLWSMQRDIADPLLECVMGQRELGQYIQEIGKRTHAGARYRKLVHTLGGEVFGSARFQGEELLVDGEVLRLSYLPPLPGSASRDIALFHVGGFIPYGDRVFRFLPEANLFLPFLAEGIGVYAMEVRPRVDRGRLHRFTLQDQIDALSHMSGVAFAHHGSAKLVVEGYCGLGLPMLTYLAARPREADTRFSAAMLMAAPVDPAACTLLGEMLDNLPQPLLSTHLTRSSIFGRYMAQEPLRVAIDIPINTLFYKTRTGQFLTGWKRKAYADVERLEDLTPEQRFELAGASWISPRTFSHHPIPPDLLRLFSQLWKDGLDDQMRLPFRDHGSPVSLRTIEQTSIPIAGFYGGEDAMIPPQTAKILVRSLGPRYRHVVHPGAGHVSYIVMPAMWNRALPFAFKPNPIDVVLELVGS